MGGLGAVVEIISDAAGIVVKFQSGDELRHDREAELASTN